jgi:hypothetical protein
MIPPWHPVGYTSGGGHGGSNVRYGGGGFDFSKNNPIHGIVSWLLHACCWSRPVAVTGTPCCTSRSPGPLLPSTRASPGATPRNPSRRWADARCRCRAARSWAGHRPSMPCATRAATHAITTSGASSVSRAGATPMCFLISGARSATGAATRITAAAVS